MDEIILLDKRLFLYLNGMGSSSFDPFWMLITDKRLSAAIYIFLVTYFLKKINFKFFFILIIFSITIILITDQVTNLFKYGFQRLRPCHDPFLDGMVRLVKNSCGGSYGYFSAHASNSFALATFFSYLLYERSKKYYVILFGFAGLVSYSRIYIGVHYPLDVFSGALFGFSVGTIFYLIIQKFSPLKIN